MSTFYKNYVKLCAGKHVSLSAVAEKIGLSRTSPHGWKKGKMPSDVNLQKIADYFGVTVEYLNGEEEEATDTKEWTVYTMGGENPVENLSVNTDTLAELTELVEIARKLPQEKIKALLNIARLM